MIYAPLPIYRTYSHPLFLRILLYSVSVHFTIAITKNVKPFLVLVKRISHPVKCRKIELKLDATILLHQSFSETFHIVFEFTELKVGGLNQVFGDVDAVFVRVKGFHNVPLILSSVFILF